MAGYKLLTYQSDLGSRAGVAIGDMVFDAAKLTGEAGYSDMLAILADWPRASDTIAKSARNAAGGWPLNKTHLRTPILLPGAMYCAGANYRDHAKEMAERTGRPLGPDPKESGGKPWHFLKPGHCVTDPGATVTATYYCKNLDWEVELAAVIGRPAKNVGVGEALNYVAGYTVANDLSARDLSQRQEVPVGSPFRPDWVGQKVFDGSCPVGPWIVPASDIPDPQNLTLKLWVNDVVKQDSNTSEMIFSLAEQIAHLSFGMTLYPGDLILTGTPAGVGMGRGEFLKAGDVVKLEIERVGTLSNTIA